MNKEKYDKITKENINKMVFTFYAHVLGANNEVSDIFANMLGDDLKSESWTKHIDLLTNFWSMIALGDTKYQGNPLMAHINMPLKRDMFATWLGMFFEVIDDLYEPDVGIVFKQRAENIAHNFINNLNLK